MKLSEIFLKLRHGESHLGLGDIRLTIAQQDDIAGIFDNIPQSIIQKYKKWKAEHPNEDYQLDEIHEFYSELDRGDMYEIMEFLESIS